ncbi:tetratricopeptide repeat protein [Gayadomonas joobiniege]|uniref:tetratricopeptide repeat protein n=1 Tax=Gayadomonas joobiniege TaxID=1234606 RepID=UPI00035FE5B9|nr:tetratricopeptide repeat protein [Gayadomonas joobiniege]
MTNKMKRLSQIVSFSLCISGINMLHANIFKGDKFYAEKNYPMALEEYKKSAEIGSPPAYYQLGTMYYKGQGVKKNNINALIWFSLAAEYQFNDSESALSQMLAALPEEQRLYVEQLVAAFQKRFGKQVIQSKYYPELITANLASKITFGGQGELATQYETLNEIFAMQTDIEIETDSFDFGGSSGFGEADFNDGFSDTGDTNSPDPLDNLFNRPYLLIADYDVAPDGSVRNIVPVQSIGFTRRAEEELQTLTLPKPNFNGQFVNFVNRTGMGFANYDKFQMADEMPAFYDRMRRIARKTKNSDKAEDIYKYAMVLKLFPWIRQEEGEAMKKLEQAANLEHPRAQYEYGLTLYREQNNVAKGIHWISSAAKYGLDTAEYRLGHILHTSPYVVNDEKKALFWYQLAAEKNHQPAMLKSAELKLLANDPSLHDQKGAIDLLAAVANDQNYNPSYHYLYAVSRIKGEYRNFREVVQHMRRAIDLGEDLNWDVSAWEKQLDSWTTGRVTISQESS